MKQKMGGLTALTVLLLTLCIGAGAGAAGDGPVDFDGGAADGG